MIRLIFDTSNTHPKNDPFFLKKSGDSLQTFSTAPLAGRTPPSNTRFLAIDFIRTVAMFAVITIHVSSTYIYMDSHFLLGGMNIAFILNQLSQFSVPMFLLLSGFSLGIKKREEAYSSFIGNRVKKVLLPYFFWFFLYEFYNSSGVLSSLLINCLDFPVLLKRLLLGHAAPHLYFIPIVFQFYLLYPLLKTMVERFPLKSIAYSLSLTLLFQGAYYLASCQISVIPPALSPYLWMLFPSWCFYFVAGMWLQTRNWSQLSPVLRGNAVAFFSVGIVFSVLSVRYAGYTNIINAIRPDIIHYTLIVFLCCVALWELIAKLSFFRILVHFFSSYSMSIYYSHVLVLCLLRYIPHLQHGMFGMLLLYLLTVLSTLCLCICTRYIMRLLKKCLLRRSA